MRRRGRGARGTRSGSKNEEKTRRDLASPGRPVLRRGDGVGTRGGQHRRRGVPQARRHVRGHPRVRAPRQGGGRLQHRGGDLQPVGLHAEREAVRRGGGRSRADVDDHGRRPRAGERGRRARGRAHHDGRSGRGHAHGEVDRAQRVVRARRGPTHPVLASVDVRVHVATGSEPPGGEQRSPRAARELGKPPREGHVRPLGRGVQESRDAMSPSEGRAAGVFAPRRVD